MNPLNRKESPKNPLFTASEEEGSFNDSTSEIYEDEENLDVEEYSVDDDIEDDVQGNLTRNDKHGFAAIQVQEELPLQRHHQGGLSGDVE